MIPEYPNPGVDARGGYGDKLLLWEGMGLALAVVCADGGAERRRGTCPHPGQRI